MSNYPELPWIAEARKHIGLKEDTSRFKHSPTILSWLKKLGAWWIVIFTSLQFLQRGQSLLAA